MDQTPVKDTLPRRSFLGILLGGGASLLVAFPLVRALAGISDVMSRDSEDEWIHVLALNQLTSGSLASVGKVRKVVTKRIVPDRWQIRDDIHKLYVIRKSEAANDFLVLSAICPHAGCSVDFKPKEKHFHCACHDGFFSAEGKVLDGPPPRALDPLPYRITEDGLEVKLVRYQLNVSERIEI